MELPAWVQQYLLEASGKLNQIERDRDGTDAIANALGFFPESEELQTKPTKALYDSLDVFSVIAGWRLKAHNEGRKLSLAKCFERHVSKQLSDREHEETVKTAYYRGKAIAESEMDQNKRLSERGV